MGDAVDTSNADAIAAHASGESSAGESSAGESSAGESRADESRADRFSADGPRAGESRAEESRADEPHAEESGVAGDDGSDASEHADDGLVSRLNVIESQPLSARAEAFARIHDEFLAQLETDERAE